MKENQEITSNVISADGLNFVMLGLDIDGITIHHNKTNTFYELEEIRRICRFVSQATLNKGSLIIDAGANIGNHSLYFGGIFPECEVHSFEMNPFTFKLLNKNIANSGLINIYPMNFGLSSRPGNCGIKNNKDLGGAQLDFNSESSKDVSLTTLDLYLEEISFSDIALIKIDVEGHEIPCLKGGIKSIEKYRPMIYLEIKELEHFREICNILSNLNYTILYAADSAVPNFLFVDKESASKIISSDEVEKIKIGLCYQLVAKWQLIRKVKNLQKELEKKEI